MQMKHLLVGIILAVLFSSCKKATRLQIDICFKAPFELSEGSDMPKDIKELLNYETIGGDSIVFPLLKFIRLDYSPVKEELLVVEHTKENKIRTAGGIIKGDNYQILKADWDEGLPKLKVGKILLEKGQITSDQAQDKKYDAIFYTDDRVVSSTNEFTDMKKLKEYLFAESAQKGKSQFTILYSSEQTVPPPPPPGNPFVKQIHDKLMQIAECKKGETKVYEERIQLANAFNAQFVDASTELKQYAGEGGMYMKSYIGDEAARYVRSLAEQDLCMTDLVIVEMNQSSTGKIGLIKIKEIQAKAP